jgi:hypothetical protein
MLEGEKFTAIDIEDFASNFIHKLLLVVAPFFILELQESFY